MERSIKRSLFLVVMVVTIYFGFQVGHLIGNRPRHDRQAVLRRFSNILTANAGNGGFGGGEALQGDASVSPQEILEQVLDRVQREYVDASGGANIKLSNGALARMVASLNDPRTSYLEPSLSTARLDALKGRYHGIGAILTTVKSKKLDVEYRHLTVVSVAPGSPAEKAGIRSGDRITEVDGRWIIAYAPRVDAEPFIKKVNEGKLTPEQEQKLNKDYEKTMEKFVKGLTLPKALPLLITGENKPLKLTVERPGEGQRKLELTTALTVTEPVEYRQIANVGYLRVRQFNPEVVGKVQTALAGINKGLKGLILDLRDNAGGVRSDKQAGVDGYDAAIKLITSLSKGGKVGMIERKAGQKEPLIVKAGSMSLPIAVLVDKGTANLSELVASSLRDTSKAKLVGSHTFGDPVLTLYAVLKNGAGIEMTHAKLMTAAGGDLAAGLTPDVAIPMGSSDDVALKSALKALGQGS